MPIIKSAIKKARQDKKAREHNRGIRDEYKDAVKAVKRAVTGGETSKKISEALDVAYSKIDRAAKRNIIHKNNASRRKSRIAALAKKSKIEKPNKTQKK